MLKPFKRFLLYLYKKYYLYKYEIKNLNLFHDITWIAKKKLKDTLFGTHTYFYGFKIMKIGENVFIGNFNLIDSSI